MPVVAQLDDVSGNRSKKWNVHYAATFCNGLLNREHMQLEDSIKFFAISQNAQPMELMEEFARQMKQAWQDSISAFDCSTRQTVHLLPYLLLIIGDNPMQAVWASSAGMNGSFPCRFCRCGGTRQDKKSTEGVLEIMKVEKLISIGQFSSKKLLLRIAWCSSRGRFRHRFY